MITQIQDIQGLVYTEYINLEKALKIIKNWNDILNKIPTNRKRLIEEKQKDYDPLLSLKKICKNNSNVNNVCYLPSKQLKNMGSLFAQSASLQGLPREIRGAISENYYDLDMVNAHPSLLLQYCKKKDIKCEVLEEYVENREEIIKTMMAKFDLDRCDVKQLFLSVLNGAKREGIIDTFFTKFKQECERIHTFVASLNPKLLKDISKRKEFNINGSLTNVILCNLENEILMYAVQFLMNNGFNVDVLIFDGCMIRKVEDKIITKELLSDLNAYVLEKTGYDIKFIEKELDTSIDLSIYKDTDNELKISNSYYKDKEEFEKTHLKITHPAIYISIIKNQIDLQSREQLLQSYQEKKTYITAKVFGKEQVIKTSFIKEWVNDENIRKYDNIVFTPPPLKHDLSDYNTWQGFDNDKKPLPAKFNLDTNEYVNRFKEYIFNLLNGRDNYIHFLTAWIANIIQFPAYRSQVCIVLYSLVEGVGKSKLIELIEKVIGEKYSFAITDVSNQMFGKHSMAEFERLFISLNEIKGKDTYSNSEIFKGRITDPKRDFEPKGLKSFNGMNYVNYICSTNNINAINANENDRRFCPMTCNNKRANDKEYFRKFECEIVNNDEAIRCIFEYLKTFPIEKYVPNRLFQFNRPMDDALYQDLKEYNREIEWDFLEHLIRILRKQTIIKITTKELWNYFEEFLETIGEKRRIEGITSKKFHFSFKQRISLVIQNTSNYEDAILYSTKEKKIYKQGFECYVFNIDKLKQYLNIDTTQFVDSDDEYSDIYNPKVRR